MRRGLALLNLSCLMNFLADEITNRYLGCNKSGLKESKYPERKKIRTSLFSKSNVHLRWLMEAKSDFTNVLLLADSGR